MAASSKNAPLYQQGKLTTQNWMDYIASAKGTALEGVYAAAAAAKTKDNKNLLESAMATRSRIGELNRTLTPFDEKYFQLAGQVKGMRDSLIAPRSSELSQSVGMERNTLMGLQRDRENNSYQRAAEQSAARVRDYERDVAGANSALQNARWSGDQWAIQRAESDLQRAQSMLSMEQSSYRSYQQTADYYNRGIDQQIAATNARIGQYQSQIGALSSIASKGYSENDWKVLRDAGVSEGQYGKLLDANIGMKVFADQAVASRAASGSSIQGMLSQGQFSTMKSELDNLLLAGDALDQQAVKEIQAAELGYKQQQKTGEVRAAQTRDRKHLPLTGVFGIPDPGVGLQIPGAI